MNKMKDIIIGVANGVEKSVVKILNDERRGINGNIK